MTVPIRTMTFDGRAPYLLAGFWSQATGFAEDPDSPSHPDDSERLLLNPDGVLRRALRRGRMTSRDV